MIVLRSILISTANINNLFDFRKSNDIMIVDYPQGVFFPGLRAVAPAGRIHIHRFFPGRCPGLRVVAPFGAILILSIIGCVSPIKKN